MKHGLGSAGRLSHRLEGSVKRRTTLWTPGKVLRQRIHRQSKERPVQFLLSRDVAPGFAGADRTGIKDSLVRHLRVCSCGMRYDLRVLPRGATLPRPITITITVEFDGFATAGGTISSK